MIFAIFIFLTEIFLFFLRRAIFLKLSESNLPATFLNSNSLSSSSMLETRAKARKQFDLIDVDKNGSISLNEAIDHLWPKLNNGTSAKHLAKNVPSWFAKIDHNGNNQIEPGEFDRTLIGANNNQTSE